jgi:molecular chaperone HtpG
MVLNCDHPLVKNVTSNCQQQTAEMLKPIESELKGLEARLAALRQNQESKKAEEISQEEKDDMANTQKAIDEQKQKKQQVIADYAKGNSIVHQLIDLALLQNGMLKGAALDKFLKRSVDLIK